MQSDCVPKSNVAFLSQPQYSGSAIQWELEVTLDPSHWDPLDQIIDWAQRLPCIFAGQAMVKVTRICSCPRLCLLSILFWPCRNATGMTVSSYAAIWGHYRGRRGPRCTSASASGPRTSIR